MYTVVSIILWLLNLLSLLIVVRALLSWFYPVGRDPWTRLLVDVTEPILAPIRSTLSRLLSIPLDLSPIAAILLIALLQRLVASAV
ncbi:MAG TPA: YggT family protein [Chloroflexia bacterium]|jgi:YggT family protein|nr:YggT family protein [Chloroflexia bacterium]